MSQPPGFVNDNHPTHVCKLHKSLYGLKQAPRAWFHRLSTFLRQLGFQDSKTDASLFYYRQHDIFIALLVYVDDIIVTGTHPTAIFSIINKLGGEFALKDLGDIHYFLGVEVTKSPSGLLLSQRRYISDLLQRHAFTEIKPVKTPMSSSATLSLHSTQPEVDAVKYRSIVGALLYVTLTRPYITFAVNKVCQFMQSPREDHWQAVKRILRYLKHTTDLGLLIRPSSNLQLHAFSDADWAGCPDDRRSTSGYAIYMGSSLISWSARKQRTVARSSTEAEYRALANATTELIWLQSLLQEIGFFPSSSHVLWCDNLGATYLTANPIFHARTKHIEIDFHFVRDQVSRQLLQVKFISIKDQIADILTKPLSTQRFTLLCSKLNLCSAAASA